MKKVFLNLVLVCTSFIAIAQTEIHSKMEKVTVYPNSALVEKSITVNLQKGENKFIIKDNASNAENLRFQSSDTWFISSMYVEHTSIPRDESLKKKLPQAVFAQYTTLNNKLEDYNANIRDCNSLKSILYTQREQLSNTIRVDSVKNMKEFFTFQREELVKINSLIDKTSKDVNSYSYQVSQVNEEINNLLRKHLGGSYVPDYEKNIVINIYSNKALANEKIDYNYLVSNVFCAYSYDVMLDEDLNRAIFSLQNNVSQYTGENWQNCEIVFSTSNTGYAGFDRVLNPYYLDYEQARALYSIDNARANTYVKKESANKSARLEEVATSIDGYVNVSNMQKFSLTNEFTLNTKQIIASGEQPNIIPLHKDTTKVSFARYSTPKNEEKVFYTALLPDWEDLGLLDASCNVYLNNRFVSNSAIITSGAADTMRFSVGEDKNVKVSRKVRKMTPDKSGFLSKEVEETVNISLVIKNTKSEKINISLKDQVPISSNPDIKITNIDLANGEIDSNSGIVRWSVNLEPREEKTITFSYTVKYPKGHRVILN